MPGGHSHTGRRKCRHCPGILLAHQYLRAAQRSRDGAAGLLAENEKRFKVGATSDNDVTAARARTALREQGVLVAEQAVRDADNQLRLLLGESAFSTDGPLLAIEPPPPPEITIQPGEDLKKAYELRPDYQQDRLVLSKGRYNESYARNQLLPQVDFVGNYGYTGLDQDFAASRRMVFNQENRAYSAGVQVTVPSPMPQAPYSPTPFQTSRRTGSMSGMSAMVGIV